MKQSGKCKVQDECPEKSQVNTRDKILHVAALLFSENGFDETSVRSICAKAGVNLALVNYHFGSKEQLYIEVHKMIHGRYVKLLPWLHSKPEPVSSLDEWEERLNGLVLEVLFMGPEKDELCQCGRRLFGFEITHPSKCLPLLLDAIYKPFCEYLQEYFRLAVPDCDDLQLRIHVMTLINQVVTYMHLLPPWWDSLLCPKEVPVKEWIELSVRNMIRMCRYSIENKHLNCK